MAESDSNSNEILEISNDLESNHAAATRAFAMTVAYKGTKYGGWQIQPNVISIQQRVEEAVLDLTGEKTRVLGSGRTDAGVHAVGQVASFHLTNWRAPAAALVPALNIRLPDDIALRQCRETQRHFHAIGAAKSKQYCYTIRNSRIPDPLTADFHYRVNPKLRVDEMRRAAEIFLGRHDFKSFEAKGAPRKTTDREISQISTDVQEVRDGIEIEITVTADGFLYNMVRNMVGALLEVGCGRQEPSWIRELLENHVRPQPFMTVPPTGLCMQRVEYDESHFLD